MKLFLLVVSFVISFFSNAQVISGPMVGHTEFRTSTIWMQFDNSVKEATLVFNKKGEKQKSKSNFKINEGTHKTATALMYNLEPANTYEYEVVANNKQVATGQITTQTLWQWREKTTPLPSFSFLTGSCTYINESKYDRPGKPYGNDSSIFETMAKEKASFMLWLGDNWYTREVDYLSEWGLHERPSRERALPVFKNFLKAMPHYAIWDDHDYGWNDADKSFPLKEASRNVFKSFWCNPSYGQNNEGIYTKVTYNDIDVFLLDDRYFRSNDDMKDSIDGKQNVDKTFYGKKQLEWLKNALLQSNNNKNITFKFIATGSQVLNPTSPYDCFRHYSFEYNDLLNFIKDNKINGVVFLTGDRHHSEIIKVEGKNNYPLYDITASPLTSGSHKFGKEEKDNSYRVVGVENMQNYCKINFRGDRKNREMLVEFFDPKGVKQIDYTINIKDVSNNKKDND